MVCDQDLTSLKRWRKHQENSWTGSPLAHSQLTMRWTLAQVFNTILISTIVISVAGSPIPLVRRKDETVDIERREPLPARRAATSPPVKAPTRRRPAAPRAAKARPAVARPAVRRTPSAPGKRTPKKFPVRSPARRTVAFPRRTARTPTKAPAPRRRTTTPILPRRARSPVPASAVRRSKVVKPLPASSIGKLGGKVSRLSPQVRLAKDRTGPNTQGRTGSSPTGASKVPISRTLSRAASITKSTRSGSAASSSPKGLKSLRSTALVAGLAAKSKAASTKQTKGPILCGRGDDAPSCSIGGGPSSSSSSSASQQPPAGASRPPLDPNRAGPDRSITAKNIKEGRPDGWRSSPEAKYLYFENADRTKAAWDEKTNSVVTVKEKPTDANVGECCVVLSS